MSIEQSDQPESKTSTSRRRVLLAGAGIAALPLITAAAGGASNQPSVTPHRQGARTMSTFNTAARMANDRSTSIPGGPTYQQHAQTGTVGG